MGLAGQLFQAATSSQMGFMQNTGGGRINSPVPQHSDHDIARINANLRSIEDMRSQMDHAAVITAKIVQRSGLKGNLTPEQTKQLTQQVENDSEYKAATAGVKTTNVGKGIAKYVSIGSAGIGAAVGGAATFAVKGTIEFVKMFAGKGSLTKLLTATAKGAAAGAVVTTAVTSPVTGLAGAAGWSRGNYNAKREKAMHEFTVRTIERAARGEILAPVAPVVAQEPTLAPTVPAQAAAPSTPSTGAAAAAVAGTAAAATAATVAAASKPATVTTAPAAGTTMNVSNFNSFEVARKAVEDAKKFAKPAETTVAATTTTTVAPDAAKTTAAVAAAPVEAAKPEAVKVAAAVPNFGTAGITGYGNMKVTYNGEVVDASNLKANIKPTVETNKSATVG